MSFVEDVYNNSIARAAGLGLALAFTLSGCAGIPVGQVVHQNMNQNLKTLKEGVRDTVKEPARVTACPAAPKPEKTGNPFIDFLNAQKPTTTLSIGDAGCTGQQGILPAPSNGGAQPATVGPRPTR